MTFAETFEKIRDRALAIGERLPENQDECLRIACTADQLSQEARAGCMPYGGSYDPWNAYIDQASKDLEHLNVLARLFHGLGSALERDLG